MSDPSAPSVNSWLEDELYHQYLYDRQTVDSGWKQVFDADKERLNPNRLPINGTTITIEPEFDAPPEMRALPAPAACPPACPQCATGGPAGPAARYWPPAARSKGQQGHN